MPEKFAFRPSIFLLFVALLCAAACGERESAEGGDTARLKTDAPAVAELGRVNQLLTGNQYLMKKDIDSLRQIYEKYPRAVVARQALLAALVRREDWQTAADLVGRVPEAERTPDERRNLAKIYLKLGRYEDALETARALGGAPNDLDLVSVSSSALFYLGRHAEAAAELDRVWPEVVKRRRSDEATIRGLIHFYQKDYAKAAETLRMAAEFNPDNVAAFNGLARVYAARGDAAGAEEQTRRVQAIYDRVTANSQKQTRFVESARQLEEAYKAGRHEEVVDLARKMLAEAAPRDKYALYRYLAQSYESLGRRDEAQKALAEAEKAKNTQQ